MQTIRIALITLLTACSTSAAWAQYGLYGSPEPLRLPQPGASSAEAAPINYPTTAMPAAQPAPVYNYPPQPQYGYPAQPPAMAAYPQYQPGTQYYYPAPASRPPLRTAAVGPAPTSQPIPIPPGPAPEPTAAVPALAPAPAPAAGYTPRGHPRLGPDEPDAERPKCRRLRQRQRRRVSRGREPV